MQQTRSNDLLANGASRTGTARTKTNRHSWKFDPGRQEDAGGDSETLIHWALRVGGDVQQYLAQSVAFAGQGMTNAEAILRATQLAMDVLTIELTHAREAHNKPHLTEKAREVLLLVNQRLSSEEIAERLCVTRNTIYKHIQQACKALNVSGRYEAVHEALLWRLL